MYDFNSFKFTETHFMAWPRSLEKDSAIFGQSVLYMVVELVDRVVQSCISLLIYV